MLRGCRRQYLPAATINTRQQRKSSLSMIVVWSCLALLVALGIVWRSLDIAVVAGRQGDFLILSSSYSRPSVAFARPRRPLRISKTPNYNGIAYHTLTTTTTETNTNAVITRRSIHPDDAIRYHQQRSALLHAMRHGARRMYDHDDEQDRPRPCERPNWRSAVFVNCNDFHQVDMVRQDDLYGTKTFLGGGYYRYAWLLRSRHYNQPPFVLKMLQLPKNDDDTDHLPSPSSFFKVHHEAIIMERLTAAPTIVDIYGHCGTSVMAEVMPTEVTTTIVPLPGYIEQVDLNKITTTTMTPCQNNLTMDEKLDIAVTMAESMAELHGFVGGVMVHGDIHPDQYLRDANGQVKLNDFNNAEVLDWNVTTSSHQYCKTDRGAWGGMYRAPEEFRGDYIDEQIDVYALGNNLYTLLTGLWPFYEDESYSVVQKKIHAKQRPFIDDRYRQGHVIEQRFVHLMEQCWEHRPEDRPSVFQVLEQLRRLKQV